MVFFDIADYWHRVFALYIEAVVKYVAPSDHHADMVHDECSCYLGQWLAKAQYASVPEFENLHLKHHRFHEIATSVIQAANQKNVTPAWLDEAIEALRQSSYAEIDAISALNRIVSPQVECDQDSSDEIDCPIRQYKLGVPIIDDQHYALVGLARRLMECPSAAFSDAENVELVTQLAILTGLHFKTEEIYMWSIQVPPVEMQNHMAAHKRILDSLTRLSVHAGQFEHLTIGDVIPKFVHWFSDHLIDYDYSLKRY
jgi:hemerythrin-like metal-binding protein